MKRNFPTILNSPCNAWEREHEIITPIQASYLNRASREHYLNPKQLTLHRLKVTVRVR